VNPTRLLVRLPNWVGDVLMARTAVEALRARWPQARLVGMAQAPHVSLVERFGLFDRVVGAPGGSGPARAAAVWVAARELRSQRLDAAVVLAPSFEAALSPWLAGIGRRVGHDTDRRRWLLTDAVAPRPAAHRTDEYLDLMRVLDAGDRPASSSPLVLTAADRAYAARLFDARAWPADSRPVFVNPAAAKTPRAWSADRFRELLERLSDAGPLVVHDRPPYAARQNPRSEHGIARVRDATLPELAALLERCALYVGNDSGPAHLAAAVGIPTVTIHGPSSPARTAPRGAGAEPHVAVSAAFFCSPCRERFFDECPSPPSADGRPPCLDAVTVDEVAAAVRQVLGQTLTRPAGP
jgi:lipopolysaccharide heptosyltransferase II